MDHMAELPLAIDIAISDLVLDVSVTVANAKQNGLLKQWDAALRFVKAVHLLRTNFLAILADCRCSLNARNGRSYKAVSKGGDWCPK